MRIEAVLAGHLRCARRVALWTTVAGALAACGSDAKSALGDGAGDADFDTGSLSDVIITYDSTTGDSAAQDTGAPPTDTGGELGDFGTSCNRNTDCNSGWCVQGRSGYVCTKLCEEICPSGYDCKSISAGGADIAFVCVPDLTCTPQEGPDYAGDSLDTNCDGIDGEVDNGVFVARNGDDDASGTITTPLQTITAALARAVTTHKRDVYVASGVYSESILLAEGKGIFGGYSSDYAVREPEVLETAVLGDPPTPEAPAAISCVGLGAAGAADKTVVLGFTVFGANAANTAGANSYAVYLRDCGPAVELRDNRILGGAGGNGQPGTAGGDGLDGVGGHAGTAAYDVGQFMANGTRICNATHATLGGAGASLVCSDGTNVSGGSGGDSACPSFSTEPEATAAGDLGAGGAAGAGGTPGWDLKIDTSNTVNCSRCLAPPDNHPFSAGLGQPGQPGSDGGRGDGCAATAGSVAAGDWVGDRGADGGDGGHGSGGGGGGSGGGVQVDGTNCKTTDSAYGTDVGGSGGGGGSGGCRGRGGAGGHSGGGSFVVFVTFTAPTDAIPVLENNVIRRGTGGFGGAGGPGGAGGVPGPGAPGGASGEGASNTFCAFAGAPGGNGGQGGQGGGGGGGCGGASYGIYVWGTSQGAALDPLRTLNAFESGGSGGTGGSGGASLGQSGTPGATGVAADTNF